MDSNVETTAVDTNNGGPVPSEPQAQTNESDERRRVIEDLMWWYRI